MPINKGFARFFLLLADRVKYFKEDEKGGKAMGRAVEELFKELYEEEKYEAMTEIAKRMLSDGILSLEKIAEYSGLTVEEVKVLAEQQ